MGVQKHYGAAITMYKMVPKVSAEYKKIWRLNDDQTCVGFIACDHEDVMRMAIDDAIKKARFSVVHVKPINTALHLNENKYGGAVTAIISSTKVADLKSAMNYIKEYIDTHKEIVKLNEEEDMGYYAAVHPKVGRYYRESLGLQTDDAIVYLSSTPMEFMFALDAALKASKAKVVKIELPPTRINTGTAILSGTESDCRSAAAAFGAAIAFCNENPMGLA